MRIKLTNKWSGEVGFVKCIHTKEKYFENTFDESEAKVFTKTTVTKALKQLNEYCSDNTYESVTVA